MTVLLMFSFLLSLIISDWSFLQATNFVLTIAVAYAFVLYLGIYLSKDLECYWCKAKFGFEIERFIHLYISHPRFFEEYDKINDDWTGEANIPDKPDDL